MPTECIHPELLNVLLTSGNEVLHHLVLICLPIRIKTNIHMFFVDKIYMIKYF